MKVGLVLGAELRYANSVEVRAAVRNRDGWQPALRGADETGIRASGRPQNWLKASNPSERWSGISCSRKCRGEVRGHTRRIRIGLHPCKRSIASAQRAIVKRLLVSRSSTRLIAGGRPTGRPKADVAALVAGPARAGLPVRGALEVTVPKNCTAVRTKRAIRLLIPTTLTSTRQPA